MRSALTGARTRRVRVALPTAAVLAAWGVLVCAASLRAILQAGLVAVGVPYLTHESAWHALLSPFVLLVVLALVVLSSLLSLGAACSVLCAMGTGRGSVVHSVRGGIEGTLRCVRATGPRACVLALAVCLLGWTGPALCLAGRPDMGDAYAAFVAPRLCLLVPLALVWILAVLLLAGRGMVLLPQLAAGETFFEARAGVGPGLVRPLRMGLAAAGRLVVLHLALFVAWHLVLGAASHLAGGFWASSTGACATRGLATVACLISELVVSPCVIWAVALEDGWDMHVGEAKVPRGTRIACAAAMLALLTWSLAWGLPALAEVVVMSEAEMSSEVRVTGHRGERDRAPENTMAAFRSGIADGAEALELDVQLSADGELVVAHDATLVRISGKDASIGELAWDEIRALDATGERWREDFHVGYPLLGEVVALARERGVVLDVELKSAGSAAGLEQAVAAADLGPRPTVCSMVAAELDAMRELAPELDVAHVVLVAYGQLEREGYDAFLVQSLSATPSLGRSLHAAGARMAVWSVRSEAQVARAVLVGADELIADDVVMAREVLRDLALASGPERALVALSGLFA